MKILFLSHQADFIYGGEVCTLAFMRELKSRGYELHFASPKGPYQDRAREFAKIHVIPSLQFSRKLHLLPRLLPALVKTHRELRKIIRSEKIEILHATSLKAMVYAWRMRGVPVLWHHHDILPLRFRNNIWIRNLARSAAIILTPSEATKAALLLAGVNEKKAIVLHNGFDTSLWKARPSRKEGSPLHLALVGEISQRKGMDILPDLLSALEGKSIKISVIGEALSEPEFAKELKQRVSKRVEFLGRREDVKELFQGIDILLVPSRQDPLPTVIVEAGLSGVPAIGSRVGGIPEMIEPGINGELADGAIETAKAILQLEKNWEQAAQGARRLAIERYDIKKRTEELLAVYAGFRG